MIVSLPLIQNSTSIITENFFCVENIFNAQLWTPKSYSRLIDLVGRFQASKHWLVLQILLGMNKS